MKLLLTFKTTFLIYETCVYDCTNVWRTTPKLKKKIIVRSSRSQMFFSIDILKSFAHFTGKHLCWSLFNKVPVFQACSFIKKRLQHSYFPVKSAKFLRIPFLRNTSDGYFCIVTQKKSQICLKLSKSKTRVCFFTNLFLLFIVFSKVTIGEFKSQKLSRISSFFGNDGVS